MKGVACVAGDCSVSVPGFGWSWPTTSKALSFFPRPPNADSLAFPACRTLKPDPKHQRLTAEELNPTSSEVRLVNTECSQAETRRNVLFVQFVSSKKWRCTTPAQHRHTTAGAVGRGGGLELKHLDPQEWPLKWKMKHGIENKTRNEKEEMCIKSFAWEITVLALKRLPLTIKHRY